MGNVAPYAGAVYADAECVSDVCCCCLQTVGTNAVYANAVGAIDLGAVCCLCLGGKLCCCWDAAYVVDVCVVAVDSSC